MRRANCHSLQSTNESFSVLTRAERLGRVQMQPQLFARLLRQEALDYFAWLAIGQRLIAITAAKRQLLVVQTEQSQ